MREENEYGYAGFIAQAIDSSTCSVATGRTVTQQDLECIGGPMEQFEYVCFM